ncbi:MAG: hypothetical protein LLF92_04190 [Planctomycetaceae bacterium]|nr:hypothetical protein [Planctomycetaceae bacterium]
MENKTLNLSQNRSLRQWLFNPFQFIAGGKALLLGIIVILTTAYIGALSNTHFDGVLDVHTGLKAPVWLFFAESIIDWLCMVLFLVLSALIVSKVQWRFIDVLGTQALSRWPALLTTLVMLPDANRRFGEYLLSKLGQNNEAAVLNPADAAIFSAALLISIIMIVWMVVLMYRAYAVSCNFKGLKAAVTFIISLILAEITSKILIVILFGSTLGMNTVMGNSPRPLTASESDSNLIGYWQSVDFVSEVNDFKLGNTQWKGSLFLKDISFNPDGTTSSSDLWKKDWIYTCDKKTKAMYCIKLINDETYLFYPWLSGDVTIRGMKPQYYVLKKAVK